MARPPTNSSPKNATQAAKSSALARCSPIRKSRNTKQAAARTRKRISGARSRRETEHRPRLAAQNYPDMPSKSLLPHYLAATWIGIALTLALATDAAELRDTFPDTW